MATLTFNGEQGTIDKADLAAAIIAALSAQDKKAEAVARKGRMQYAKRALGELAVELGIATFESKAAKSDAPKELLTDQQKAQRIVERNEARGWQTSQAVRAVADGTFETFDAAKTALAAKAEEAKATPAPKPAKRTRKVATKS